MSRRLLSRARRMAGQHGRWAGITLSTGVTLAGALPNGVDVNPGSGCGVMAGCGTAHDLVSWAATMLLFLAVLAFVGAAALWASGHLGNNPRAADQGKSGTVITFLAVVLIGGANIILGNAFGLGGAFH